MQQPGSITFGTPKTPASSAPAFGTNPSLFGTASTFGASTGQPGLTYGGPPPNTTLFSGGAPSNLFGSSPATAPTFGAPITSTSSGFGGFNAPASTATGFNFGATGAPTTASTGYGFGTQTSTAPFGAQGSAQSTGLTFGQPINTTAATSLSFGTSTSGGLNFGAPAPTAQSGFGFGAATSAPTGLFGSAPSTSTAGINFGAPVSSAAPFGSQPATSSNLFGSSGLAFKPTQTSAPSFGLQTSSAISSNALTSQGQGLFGARPSAPPVGLGGSQIPTLGLGGVDTSQFKTDGGSSNTKGDQNKAAKESALPNEVQLQVEGFKNHVKQQKLFSSDVARSSIKPMKNVKEGIELLKSSLTEIGNGLILNRQRAEKLKFDAAKCLSHTEMAQRTHDTPPGFQFDNTAPLQFFIETVNQFEIDLNTIRHQIEATEKHINSFQKPTALTSQELAVGMKKLHETFIALAGRLQTVHSQVEIQKDQYLNFRKHVLKDPTNVFEKTSPVKEPLNVTVNTTVPTQPKRAAGPTPFSTLGNMSYGFLSQVQPTGAPQTSAPQPAYPGLSTNTLSWGSSNQTQPTGQPPSYSASIGLTTATPPMFGQAQTSDNFQLQKPPVGNKRGKH